eukprot:5178419-Ditylum_brightwellii.AAC.2
MGGVNVSNQHISYYHPSNIVCQYTWIPIFIQLLSIIQNNAHLVHKDNLNTRAFSHQQFTYEMIL